MVVNVVAVPPFADSLPLPLPHKRVRFSHKRVRFSLDFLPSTCYPVIRTYVLLRMRSSFPVVRIARLAWRWLVAITRPVWADYFAPSCAMQKHTPARIGDSQHNSGIPSGRRAWSAGHCLISRGPAEI